MDRPKQPCKKDCPRRSAECHVICEDWLKYEKERNENYLLKGKELELIRIANDIERERKRNMAERKKRR